MPPKLEPKDSKVVYLRYTAGEVSALSALTPKGSPLGLSPTKPGDDNAKATSDCKGLRIIAQLTNRPFRTDGLRWKWYLLPLP